MPAGNNKSLLVVGSVAFDSIETPNGSVADALGCSATYFSYAASVVCLVLFAISGGYFLRRAASGETRVGALGQSNEKTSEQTGQKTGENSQTAAG